MSVRFGYAVTKTVTVMVILRRRWWWPVWVAEPYVREEVGFTGVCRKCLSAHLWAPATGGKIGCSLNRVLNGLYPAEFASVQFKAPASGKVLPFRRAQ